MSKISSHEPYWIEMKFDTGGHKTLTLATKADILKKVQKGEYKAELAAEYGI